MTDRYMSEGGADKEVVLPLSVIQRIINLLTDGEIDKRTAFEMIKSGCSHEQIDMVLRIARFEKEREREIQEDLALKAREQQEKDRELFQR